MHRYCLWGHAQTTSAKFNIELHQLTVKFNLCDDAGLHGVGRDLGGREIDLHGLGHGRGDDVLHGDRLVAGVEQQELDGGGRAVGGQ